MFLLLWWIITLFLLSIKYVVVCRSTGLQTPISTEKVYATFSWLLLYFNSYCYQTKLVQNIRHYLPLAYLHLSWKDEGIEPSLLLLQTVHLWRVIYILSVCLENLLTYVVFPSQRMHQINCETLYCTFCAISGILVCRNIITPFLYWIQDCNSVIQRMWN